jgi:hypothetical protein
MGIVFIKFTWFAERGKFPGRFLFTESQNHPGIFVLQAIGLFRSRISRQKFTVLTEISTFRPVFLFLRFT